MALKNRRTQNKKSNKRQQSKRGGTRKSARRTRIARRTRKRGGGNSPDVLFEKIKDQSKKNPMTMGMMGLLEKYMQSIGIQSTPWKIHTIQQGIQKMVNDLEHKGDLDEIIEGAPLLDE